MGTREQIRMWLPSSLIYSASPTFSQVSEATLSTQASPKRSAFCLSIPHSTRRRWVVMGGVDERGLPRSGGAQGNQSKRLGTTTHKHTTGHLNRKLHLCIL